MKVMRNSFVNRKSVYICENRSDNRENNFCFYFSGKAIIITSPRNCTATAKPVQSLATQMTTHMEDTDMVVTEVEVTEDTDSDIEKADSKPKVKGHG